LPADPILALKFGKKCQRKTNYDWAESSRLFELIVQKPGRKPELSLINALATTSDLTTYANFDLNFANNNRNLISLS